MESNERKERPILRMILAGMASVIAGGTTHPIDTVKIRLQKEGEVLSAERKYKNVFRALGVITREEGFFALYKGLLMSLSREASYSTLRLGLYEPYKVQLILKN
jgi:hypothetical protein